MGRFGTWEIAIIALIALVIFGGKRLPELGRGLGKGIANFRESIKGFGCDLTDKPKDGEQNNSLPAGERQA